MIFTDTGAWIALLDKSDRYHDEAVLIYSKLKQKKEKFLTTDYVIDETVTRLRYDSTHCIAVKFLELIENAEQSGILKIIRIDEKIYRDAVSIFCKYDTAVLSFTDCTSFAVCRDYNIYKAFAFDQHFTMMNISLCSEQG